MKCDAVEPVDEMLKIYDASRQFIGIKDRQSVHTDGDIHYVIHCWLYLEATNQIVLQRRSEEKRFGGGLLDVSCAGHYSADEDFESTREIYEELGIAVNYVKLKFLYEFEETFLYDSYYDHEIAKVHLLKWHTNKVVTNVSDEVAGFVFCGIQDFISLLKGEIDCIRGTIDQCDKIEVHMTDFVKRNDMYYQNLCDALINEMIDEGKI